MDFNTWYTEVADMPTKGVDGGWHDAETGISFLATSKRRTPRTQLEREVVGWTLKALKERCERIVAGQDNTSKRFRGIYNDEVLDRAAASAEAGRTLLADKKTKKVDFIIHASENVLVTQSVAKEKSRVYGANGKITAPII